MATITMASAQVTVGVRSFTWEAMGNADTGTAMDSVGLSDKTVSVTGSFGGATVTIQGSNDGTNWLTLHDQSDNDLALTAAGIALIAENPLQCRAITSGGTDTDVDVIIIAKGNL